MNTQTLTPRILGPWNAFQDRVALEPGNALEEQIKHIEQTVFPSQLTRRRFFKTAGLVAGSVVAMNTVLFPKKMEAIPVGSLIAPMTKELAKAILAAAVGYVVNRGLDYVLKKIEEARILETQLASKFHDRFSEEQKLDLRELPLKTRFDYFFAIDGYPQTGQPFAPEYELNVIEMQSLLDISRNGEHFVPYPVSLRKEPVRQDFAAFRNAVWNTYEVNLQEDEFEVKYVRDFFNGNNVRGYGVASPRIMNGRAFLLAA